MLDRDTGEIVAEAHGGEPDYMASESKLLIVIDVLEQRRAGKIVPERGDCSCAGGRAGDGTGGRLVSRVSADHGALTTAR